MKSNFNQFRRRFSLQVPFSKINSEDTDRSTISEIIENDSQERTNETVKEEKSKSRHFFNKPEPTHLQYKIVVAGAPKTGKTAIVNQFLYGYFVEKYKKTIDENHHAEFSVHDSHLVLDILDLSGTNDFPAMRVVAIRSAQAFILVYDVTELSTFDEVTSLRDEIFNINIHKNDLVPIVVVGNKIDLERKMNTEHIQLKVKSEWKNGYVECSAKDGTNVPQIFKELLAEAKVTYNLSPALKRYRRKSLPSTMIQQHLRRQSTQPVPRPDQLQHLQDLRDKHSKRTSCTLS